MVQGYSTELDTFLYMYVCTCSNNELFTIAYWIAQKAVKIVYDHVDGLQPSPHDITTVQNRMNDYFKVCVKSVPVCSIRVNTFS